MGSEHVIAPVRSVLLHSHDAAPAREAVARAARWLRDHDVSVFIPLGLEAADAFEGCTRIDPMHIEASLDLVIALGGDGTLLVASRWVAEHEVPVVGVNHGDLGFLTAFARPELEQALEAAVSGRLQWAPRMRLLVEVRRGGELRSTQTACNDAYIKHGEVPRMLEAAVTLSDKHVARYRADGLIVATPMGSTAYNLAAGGPIVEPGTNTVIVTPICPHSLTHRPVVVGCNERITIEVVRSGDDSPVSLSVDGQSTVQVAVGDEITVTQAAPPLRLVPPRASVFHVLATKMGWSGPDRG